MSDVFGEKYAGVYDALYGSKDYASEADLIGRLLARYGDNCRRLLDLGCGTGNHAFPLAERGYTVVGVDRSAAMINKARAKARIAEKRGVSIPEFLEGEARKLDLGQRFDAVLMMFTVLGYQCNDADLVSTLGVVRRHLEPGGLFIFDVWNGAAVLSQGLTDRVARAAQGSTAIARSSHSTLDAERRLCYVRFDIEKRDGGQPPDMWQETHLVRYFFPDELTQMLLAADLSLIDLKRFPDGEAPPDEHAWNVIGIARAGAAERT